MHEKLTQFRQKLGSSMKEFRDLPDFKAQLAYFFDLFTELKIVPAPWLIYGACAAYLHQKTGGRLVESTASTFESSEVLAQFCGMRARYVILGLKDLFNMKILKCSEEIGKSISEMASELDTNQSCGLESFSSSGDGAGVTFVSAITAFDADTLMQTGCCAWNKGSRTKRCRKVMFLRRIIWVCQYCTWLKPTELTTNQLCLVYDVLLNLSKTNVRCCN